MSILMNEIKSSLFCFGDSVVTNLHGIGSSIRITHNLNSLDRRISKFDRIAKAYSKTYTEGPEVETLHPEEKSKVTFDKEVSETVEFEENSNVVKKPAEEKNEPVEKGKVISEPVKEESKVEEEAEIPEEAPKTESAETTIKSTEKDVATKPEEVEALKEAPKTESVTEKEPEPVVQQKPKVKLEKEDIDKIIDMVSFQSKAEHKDTAAIIANSIINNIINNPKSDLNQKLASNIEQITKVEDESKESTQKTVTKTSTPRRNTANKKSSASRKNK